MQGENLDSAHRQLGTEGKHKSSHPGTALPSGVRGLFRVCAYLQNGYQPSLV